MRITIYSKEENKNIALRVSEQAKAAGFIIDEENPEVVISVGGDGTFLRAIQKYIDKLYSIKLVAVNFGTLGFFAQYQREELDQLFLDLKNNNYQLKQPKLLNGVATYEDGEKVSFYAINEVRIENPFRTLTCDVYINDELLESFRGNGLIFASSIGSSAYNRSLGGALVDISIPSIQLTEIASIENNLYHSLGSSLVVDESTTLKAKGRFNKSVVGYDSLFVDKENLASLEVKLANKKINIIYRKDFSLVKMYRKSFVK